MRASRCLARLGLIPAHAGKTEIPNAQRRVSRAHPRSRGENLPISQDRITPSGSSPLTRGKRGATHHHVKRCGLIPAHAGKTPPRTRSQRGAWAHPRSRGENGRRRRGRGRRLGSSPLTRGKPRPILARLSQPRLIPAHAGKTSAARRRGAQYGAHPRSRGENAAVRSRSATHMGSSPLTRGKQRQHYLNVLKTGLIPAHAGKTRRCAQGLRPTWAHPRSRGENAIGNNIPQKYMGSSPLTRGKLFDIW